MTGNVEEQKKAVSKAEKEVKRLENNLANYEKSIVRANEAIEEAEQIPRIIAEGERILEIGAGIGLVSTLCARNPKTASLSIYEADPRLVEYLNGMFELNGVSAEVTNGILSDSLSAPASFYIRKPYDPNALLLNS